MAGNRKAAESVILEYIEKLLPGSENVVIYRSLFDAMNDEVFDDFMTKLDEDKIRLAIIAPNFDTRKLTVENNFAIADELGHNFFERIWLTGDEDTPSYLSPVRYLIVDLPLRRQAQLLVKKISIPEDNKSIDDFTGQPTGKSKGSKISYPELQIMAALDLDENIEELMKFRGGDIKGFDAMNASISKTGGVSLKAISSLGTEVRSTQTMKTLLKCMHLDNTL